MRTYAVWARAFFPACIITALIVWANIRFVPWWLW